MDIVVNILFSVYLLVLALIDIKKRELKLSYIAGGLLFIPLFYLCGRLQVTDSLLGLIPGVLFLILYYITGKQIGMADVILVLVLGLDIGLAGCISVISAALLLVAPVAVVLLVSGKLTRKSSVPFVPFIFAGNLLRILLNM